jgi:hypothetical protein
MKILIIAHARSGSTNCLLKISNILKIEQYHEPYNISMTTRGLLTVDFSKDCIVKTLSTHVPNNENPIDFYTNYVTKFDIVILLFRKNKIEAEISLANAKLTRIWHDSYINHIFKIPKSIKVQIDNSQSIIKTLSNSLNLPITYYEDLYSGDYDIFKHELEKIGLDKYTDKLFTGFNPKNRHRNPHTPTKLL